MTNSARRLLAAGSALTLLAAMPVAAQFASPVGSPQQQGDTSFGTAAAGRPEAPAATIAPFEPVNIESPPALSSPKGKSDRAKAEETRRSDQALTSEFESFVSTLAGKNLRRFGAELLQIGRAHV